MKTTQNIKTTKKYLFVKRAKIMIELRKFGYSFADIGIMFNIDRAWAKRVIDKQMKFKKIKLK